MNVCIIIDVHKSVFSGKTGPQNERNREKERYGCKWMALHPVITLRMHINFALFSKWIENNMHENAYYIPQSMFYCECKWLMLLMMLKKLTYQMYEHVCACVCVCVPNVSTLTYLFIYIYMRKGPFFSLSCHHHFILSTLAWQRNEFLKEKATYIHIWWDEHTRKSFQHEFPFHFNKIAGLMSSHALQN